MNEADGVVPNPRQEIPRRRSCDAIANEDGGTLLFRVRDPKLDESVPVRYEGAVPDPFAVGRGVLVTVQDQGSAFVGQPGSLTTKCPSKFQDANAKAT